MHHFLYSTIFKSSFLINPHLNALYCHHVKIQLDIPNMTILWTYSIGRAPAFTPACSLAFQSTAAGRCASTRTHGPSPRMHDGATGCGCPRHAVPW